MAKGLVLCSPHGARGCSPCLLATPAHTRHASVGSRSTGHVWGALRPGRASPRASPRGPRSSDSAAVRARAAATEAKAGARAGPRRVGFQARSGAGGASTRAQQHAHRGVKQHGRLSSVASRWPVRPAGSRAHVTNMLLTARRRTATARGAPSCARRRRTRSWWCAPRSWTPSTTL